MPSNSRPPLTSRIRASFDGKRSKSEVTSPTLGTNGFITQQPDPESLQKAVDQALSSDAFQDAISANLAKLLKPTIKSALDTIQPVVETVYNHEVLLRQTNKSVENLLERLDTVSEAPESDIGDPQTPTPATPRRRTLNLSSSAPNIEAIKQLLEENQARTFAKLSELSGSVETSNIRIVEALDGISGINAILYPTREGLDSVKSISEQSHTATSVIQAQLDQLSQDVGTILEAIWKDLSRKNKALDTSLFSQHTSKLDAISSNIASLKGHADSAHILQNISENLEIVKDNVEHGNVLSKDNFAAMKPQFEKILASVEAQPGTSAQLRETADPSREILDAIKKSNDSHAAHAVVLNQIQEKSGTSGFAAGSSHPDPEIAETLEALKADLKSLKENIVTGIATSHEDMASLGTKVEDVLVTLEAHKANDLGTDILAEVKRSNDSLATHALTLDEMKSINATAPPSNGTESILALDPKISSIIATLESHTASLGNLNSSHSSALEGIRSMNAAPSPVGDIQKISNLESQVTNIISTLESHTSNLENLLAATPQTSSVALDAIETNIGKMSTLLETNSIVLNELKDDVSAEVLTILNDHSSMLSEIKESDVSEEILTSINDSHAIHTTTLADIHTLVHALNAIHTSHAEAVDENGSMRGMGRTPVTGAAHDASGIETQIKAITTTLEEQNVVLSTIKEAAITHIDSLGGHAAALAEIKEATHSTKTFQGSHDTSLAELRGVLTASVDSHASHSKALAELKDANLAAIELHASHITSLAELKSEGPASKNNSVELDALQVNFDTIISSLDVQAATLSEIKNATSNLEVLATVKDSQELLQSHSILLKSMTDSDSREDILRNILALRSIIDESRAEFGEHGASVKDLHDSTKASHSDITQAIAALAVGGVTGTGVGALISKDDDHSADLLEGVNVIKAIVEKSSASIDALRETTSSTAAQIDINHTTITTSITTLSDEIKSEIDATGTEITSSLTTLSGDIKNIDSTLIDTIIPNVLRHSAAINENGTEIRNLKSSLSVLHGIVQETGVHVINLKDLGLHLNENGVDQLKQHAISSARKHSFPAQNSGDKETWWKKPEPGGDSARVFPSQGDENSTGRTQKLSAFKHLSSNGDKPVTENDEDIEEPSLISISQVPKNLGSVDDAPLIKKSDPVEDNSTETIKIQDPQEEKAESLLPAREELAALQEEHKAIQKLSAEEDTLFSAAKEERVPTSLIEPQVENPIQPRVDDKDDGPSNVEAPHTGVSEDHFTSQFIESPSGKEAAPAPVSPSASPNTVDDVLDIPKSANFSSAKASEDPPARETINPNEHLNSPNFSGEDTESANTSAIASPMSPSFAEKGGKGGKKGKKEKKEKKEKKGKKEKKPFVFDPDEEEEEEEGGAA